MLYLVGTPIGNLGDISYRAVMTLDFCDYILCEDTRHSRPMLSHYGISKPLKSFHKFSEASKEDKIILDLLNGKNIALITDAGTPGISDPGTRLVKRCQDEGFSVTAVPGACAAILALTLSGLDTERFQFFGFLPKKTGELKKNLIEILLYTGTTVCYETANRLPKTLKQIDELNHERIVVVARELTKKFEEVRQGTPSELLKYWKSHPLKGEIVLLISGEKQPSEKWKQLSPDEHVTYMEQTYHLSRKEAIKLVAELRGVPKRDIYKLTH